MADKEPIWIHIPSDAEIEETQPSTPPSPPHKRGREGHELHRQNAIVRAPSPPPIVAAAAAAAEESEPEEPTDERKKKKGAVRRWCFTVNNPGDWTPLDTEQRQIAYMVWQTEMGKKRTPHVQGYIRFKGRKRMNTVKNFFGRRDMHCEIAEGDEETNRKYCTKDETRIEGTHGELGTYDAKQGKQGHRSDLDSIAEKCQRGHSLREIAEAHPTDYIRYGQGIARLHELLAPPPAVERVVTTWVLWGPTGVGKTHRVLTNYPSVYQVIEKGRDPWGRYNDQPVLLLDEFNWRQWTPQEMNSILDKWRFPLNCRYHDKFAAWTLVYICCNDNPNEWYNDGNTSQALRDAVRRRLHASCRYIANQEPSLDMIQLEEPQPNWA